MVWTNPTKKVSELNIKKTVDVIIEGQPISKVDYYVADDMTTHATDAEAQAHDDAYKKEARLEETQSNIDRPYIGRRYKK